MRLVLVLMACLGSAAGQAKSSRPVFGQPDGHWWLTATAEARTGFANGQIDCDAYMLHRAGPAPNLGQFMDAITRYYRAHPSDLCAPVTTVISRLNQKWQAEHTYPVVRSTGTYYNSDIWWNAPPANRDGFIRGFLACQAAEQGVQVRVSVATIVQRVSRWYGIDPKHEGVVSPATAKDELSSVILHAEKPAGIPEEPL